VSDSIRITFGDPAPAKPESEPQPATPSPVPSPATEAWTKAEVEITPEHRAAIENLSQQIDLSDPGSILRFGQEAQTRAQAAADAMLGSARNQETGEAGRTLSSLLTTLRGFDVTKLDERPGFFQRIFTKTGAEITGIIQRYESVKGQIETIGDKLDAHRTRLLEDVERLERLYAATLDWFHALGTHISAGEVVLRRTDTETIPALDIQVKVLSDRLRQEGYA
jgi:uncharacterized protein YaaN involved in tellurite resistance